jgi:uncharacterized membrane protein HdeD (DUF308 family)
MDDYDGCKGFELGKVRLGKVRLFLGVIAIISFIGISNMKDDLGQTIYGFALFVAIVLWIIIEGIVKVFFQYRKNKKR